MFSVSGVPVKEHCVQEQERLRQECLHLQARLLAAQTECQKEREVRILHLKFCIASWISVFVNSMCLFLCICRRSSCCVSGCFRVELSYSSRQTSALVWDLRRAVFCGAAPPERTQSHTGWLTWVILTALPVFLVYKEHTVFSQSVFSYQSLRILSVPLCFSMHMEMQGKLQPFLALATQTLESFVRSLDDEVKTQTEDHNSQEHQFVLGLAGTITSELNALVDTCAIYIAQHI